MMDYFVIIIYLVKSYAKICIYIFLNVPVNINALVGTFYEL